MKYTGERFIPLNNLMNDETAFEHFHRYYHALGLVKDKIVLDIACGEGYGSALLAREAKKVYGVDIDKTCIESARKKYQEKNVEFMQGDVSAILLPDNSIDVIISFETIEHLDEKTQEFFLKEIRRVIKKNGKLIISTPDKTNYSERYAHQNEFHIKEFTKEEFYSFLNNYFLNIVPLGQRYEIIDAITGEDLNEESDAKIYNWDRSARPIVSKYLVFICSDSSVEKEWLKPSVVFQVSKDYWQVSDRIVEMESHILELGAWGRRLDKEIEERNVEFNKKLKELEDLSAEKRSWLIKESQLEALGEKQSATIHKLSGDLETKNNLIASFGTNYKETTEKLMEMQARLMEVNDWTRKFHNELLQKEVLLSDRNRELENLHLEKKSWIEKEIQYKEELKKAERNYRGKDILLTQQLDKIKQLEGENNDRNKIIDEQNQNVLILRAQLDSINKRLAEIYESDGWKVLKRYYNIKGKLLPENSGRYKALKRMVNKVRGKKENNIDLSDHNRAQNVFGTQQEENADQPSITYEIIEFPLFELPAVSIIIPAYNGWDLTYKCLASIKENTLGVSYEIIIGDDASTDETKDIKNYIKNIVVIRNEKNLEFLHNCNHAATYAKGKYILFLNNDTEVRSGWLSSMVDLMEKDETIGMVGSKLIYPNGKLQEAGAIIWKDASGWNYGMNQDPDAPEFNYVKEVDYISGASIILRRQLWEEIGGFDKRYTPAYCEDSDLAFEIRKRGYRVVYQPLSEVIHFEGYTHGTDKNEGIKGSEIKAYQKLNNGKFREKWRSVLLKEHFPNGENLFWAKDRSSARKTILVIDHYVPHFDKDAGSKTVFQYLKLLVLLNMNVKFIGDNFYRHEPYTTALQQLGIEVLYGPHYANNWKQWILENHDKFDYVLLNRPHVSIKYIDFIREHTNATILYYGHDLHFVRLAKQHGIENKNELLDEAEKWKQIEISIFNKANVILTPSEDEKSSILKLGVGCDKVFAIKPYIFEKQPNAIDDFSNRRDILFVGGFTHVPNVDAVLWFVNEIWPLVRHKIADAKFIIAGSNVPAEIKELESSHINVLGFISEEALQKLYTKVKMVVVPLRYGAGVKGKTVEAMYNGVPLVTTDFGVEGLPGDSSFISPKNNPKAFADEVIRLYNASNNELASLSNRQTQYIHDHFYFEIVKSELQTILDMHTERLG